MRSLFLQISVQLCISVLKLCLCLLCILSVYAFSITEVRRHSDTQRDTLSKHRFDHPVFSLQVFFQYRLVAMLLQ